MAEILQSGAEENGQCHCANVMTAYKAASKTMPNGASMPKPAMARMTRVMKERRALLPEFFRIQTGA